MNLIDFKAISAELDAAECCKAWLPKGKRQGREWVSRNPNRADNSPGSFSVNMETGRWADFAAGADACGGDLVSLYAYLRHGGDQGAAARELMNDYRITVTDATREAAANVRKIDDAKPVPIFPVPMDATAPTFKHFKFGEPTRTHEYRDENGRTLLYVVRFDPPDMRKQVVPRSWCSDPKGGERWAWRGITKGKVPLYGLDRLAESPDAAAVVVEGEKATDAGVPLLAPAGYVVTSWLGGVARASDAALSPLHGRDVILWPDFDAERDKETGELLPVHKQPGMRAMLEIAAKLKGKARVQIVGYVPGEWEHGHDIADGWTSDRALAYMREHAGDPKDVGRVKAPAPPAPEPEAEAEPPRQYLPLNCAINPFSFPDLSAKSVPLNTRENVEWLMMQHGITARYDEMSKSVELDFPGREFYGDTRHDNALTELSSVCARNLMPTSMLASYVKNIANDAPYSPVREWVEATPWDGVTRIPAMLATLRTPEDSAAIKDVLVYRWMISAVAAAWRAPDFESHGVLVFTGKQGEGKTTWFRRLAPSDMGAVMVGASVDPSDKDSVTKGVSHWIVELGELDATFRKADIARLKAFATSPVDRLRRPYDRLESVYKRQTVFGASVNEDRYLVDDTGNRRWWTVPVIGIDYMHDLDMQQVWAEVLTHYQRGEQWWLTKDEQERLNALNERHEAVDPLREMILRRFDFESDYPITREQMTATEVLRACGYPAPNQRQATHASKILRELTGREARPTKSGRLFDLPRRIGRDVDAASPF